ncbi:PAS domain-containing protein [Pseudomonas syringae]|nr:PAS domain-containing protein [Pseudomonas syringae]MBD8575086.1 PAS domain-containing protein [Pseudomonas syringae]MBD8789474.1 PAS domain-containing protein [Pseudomonas syringae]MBD8800663.1 PAS domain-containing protein [Pseudomonas syringae]MBD8812044.1 PAS domain-containing protein [Pseudomonas syringae]
MTSSVGFPVGNSEAARVIRHKDWNATSLGPVDQWPGALKTALYLMLESPVSMYLIWGPELLFFHNDAYTPILGPRAEGAIGMPIAVLWSDVWDQVRPMAENALAGEVFQAHDLPLSMARYGQPEQTWWTFCFSPLRDEHGQVLGVFCCTNETTRHVLDQRALKAGELQRQTLIEDLVRLERRQTARLEQRTMELDTFWEMSPDLLAIVDVNGCFQRVNPAWSTLLDLNAEDLIGTSITDRLHPDDIEPSRQALAHALNQELPLFENRYRHRDGSYRWFGWTAAPGRGLVFALGKHMTEEKLRTEALRTTEEALRQSQKMEAVGQLTGGLAHDFNNLLMGVTGNIELLQMRISQGRFDDLGRYITGSLESSRRAAALTHRLLAFSRRQTLAPRPTNIDALVQGMAELVQRTVGPAIDMQVSTTPDLWSTLVDPNQLENALLNLCNNARDAMPDGGRLLIETTNLPLDATLAGQHELPPGHYVALCVSDTGTGMSPEVIGRAFDPFFTTKPLGMGTGLGLSMIYGFARQSGGDVRIVSTPGLGSKISIYLPVVQNAHEPGPTVEAVPAELARSGIGEIVLVVDDEPAVRQLISEVLVDLGYAVLQAEHGAAALKILQQHPAIQLLVTDVGLPGGMNGRQLADAARVLSPALSVLFVTGYAESAALTFDTLGRDMHVLTKPFSIATLSGCIARLRQPLP